MPDSSTIKRVAALTLGCKVNLYDTEAMLELFRDRGYEIVPFESNADIYIVNTCTVTNLSDKKSRQMINRAVRNNALVIAAGCYAQVSPDAVKQISGVNLVLGTNDRDRVVEIAEAYTSSMGVCSYVTDVSANQGFDLSNVSKFTANNRTRAFLKIQDGCDRFCSYCIIPYARGPARSRKPEDVLVEANHMADNGAKEIVIAGIHVASYGKDLKNTSLTDILRLIDKIEAIERIRLSSIDPTAINNEFVDVLCSLNKICDHFHLSLQSGSNRVLQSMNRRYTAEDYREYVNILRSAFPDASLTTDIIVGFPGETKAEFEETYDLAEEIGFSKIHVFPFSSKKGTAAAEMSDQVSKAVKSERARLLTGLSEQSGHAYIRKFIGKTLPVLFEQPCGFGAYEGFAANYIKMRVESCLDITNQICMVRVEHIQNDYVFGAVLQNG